MEERKIIENLRIRKYQSGERYIKYIDVRRYVVMSDFVKQKMFGMW